MKTKLYVAGIGGCLLLTMAYLKPFELFSSDLNGQSKQELSGTTGLLNYEKSNIPGLEIKTPAKIAIINKVAAVQLKKEAEKKKSRSEKSKTEESMLEITANSMMDAVKDLVLDEPEDSSPEEAIEAEASPELHPYMASARTAAKKIAVRPETYRPRPQVNVPSPELPVALQSRKTGRTVINYQTTEYAVNTSNTLTPRDDEKFPHENEKFPHDSDEAMVISNNADVVVNTAAEAKVEKVEKVEKTLSFRGKTEVKSDLYKYIPPFWDGFSAEIGNDEANYLDLMKKAKKLAEMARKGGYNTQYAFLLDMSVKSNKNRFFIVNLKTMKVEKSSLVAQGRGRERLNLDKEYSNVPGSNCSSLGIYKVGKSYNGSFGLSYRLHGLESSNSKALQRYIVLHAMGTIPDVETNFPIWQSEGCPSVSPKMLDRVGNMIDKSGKPILMWMYDETFIPMI
ncbi:murein L,D-transpeptidase catalytic domain-containing protein [Flavihumibacter stibioxidans]|uniref:murein L,D-transpeptidase catalytic domain-containing protein n=1 Tax=Flavihumibacter stibioxidans TaxID=1834163 RepID=UPI00164F689F|nr:murein L,D-transpeptidase catalytic domain family protein [Flavihumibacter stibioxidans]